MKPKAFLAVALVAATVIGAGAETAVELPPGYTAVDYIVAPNGAYIDTGYWPSDKTRVAMDVTVQGAWEYWFGTWNVAWNDGAYALGNDNGEVYCGYGSGSSCGGIKVDDKGLPNGRVTVALEKGVVYTNDVVWSNAHRSDATFSVEYNLYLFAQNRKGTAKPGDGQGDIICHGCTISEGSVVKRNFVPCVRESDQAVGLYDLAASDPSKAFYANAGSGKFGVPEGTFCTVTVGAIKNMTAAYTFGDGSVTNAVEGTSFGVLPSTTNLTVIFTAADGCRFADDSTVKTVTRDEVTGDLDLTAETPVAHKVQPMATITKITNRYPWNGKIDVEYELSNLELAFSPIDALVTKFTSGDIEVTKTNDLSDAELAARTARRTFDCRELFGEGKRDAQAQSAAKLSPLDYDYAVIDVSGGANATSYPVTYYKSAPEGGWNTDEYKTDKIVLYYVKEGKYWGNQKTEQTTTGFWIGVFSVTEAQYAKVMGSDDKKTTKPIVNVTYTTLRGTDNPNATVTGDSFLKRLCDRTGLDGFDLPTDSQWEIACRAGTTTDYYWGNSKWAAGQYMWYEGNSWDERHSGRQVQGVGQKFPNAWGLYDMLGNVWEWCRDGYHDSLTVDSSADVCLDPEAGRYLGHRVLRGSSFDLDVNWSSYCYHGVAGDAGSNIGFRLSRMCSKGKSGLAVNEQNGADDVWMTGPSFSFDTREKRTIAGTEAETLTYSGDDWGAGGTGVTVWYSLDGGEAVELKAATDSGTVSWTPTLNGRYEFSHVVTDGTTETAVFVVNELPGREGAPWEIGEGVTAYVKDHVIYLKGEGEVTEFGGDGAPWAGYGETLTGIGPLSKGIVISASVAATLPISVNGGEPVLPEGTIPVSKVALEKAGVETLAIEDGTAYLGISVRTNGDLTAETASWGKVKFDEKTPVGVSEDGTALLIPVPANAKSGFMTLWSGEATKAQGVQLWAGGPFWAECNVGAEQPGDYGTSHKFQDAQTAVSAPWRVPTKDEMNGLLANCDRTWTTAKNSKGEDVAGYRFTSKADSSKSIFLPAAGFDIGTGRSSAGTFGYYWSATVCSPAWSGYDLNFGSSSPAKVSDNSFSYRLSVRAVRDQL